MKSRRTKLACLTAIDAKILRRFHGQSTKEIEQRMYQLFVPQRFLEDLEAQGVAPGTAAMKVQERKKDVRRVEAALESLGIPFRHQREGTTARLSEADRASLLALLPAALPARAEMDMTDAFES